MREDSILITCIAGAFAALSVDAIIFPFDTLRTRLQAPDYAKRFRNQTTGIVNRAALFRGLYQGVGTTALAMIPSSGAFFVTYDNINHVLERYRKTSTLAIPTFLVHAASSSIAEAVSCVIITPAEVLKQNAQMLPSSKSSKQTRSSSLQTFNRLKEQPRLLWRGYPAMLTRNLPTTGIKFPLFEIFKRRLSERWLAKQGRTIKQHYNAVNSIPLFERTVIAALSASVSGSVAAFLVTPVDVVKTRMMLGDESNLTKTRARTEMLTILRQVYAENGISGLFRGASIRSAWAAVGTGLYLSSYEWAKVMLHNVKP